VIFAAGFTKAVSTVSCAAASPDRMFSAFASAHRRVVHQAAQRTIVGEYGDVVALIGLDQIPGDIFGLVARFVPLPVCQITLPNDVKMIIHW